MVDSKIFSKEFTKRHTRKISKKRKYGMSIGSLMIWLLTWLNQKEDLSGHVKTMMVMFKVIVLLKVSILFIKGYGSLGLMTSVLVAPDGSVES